MLSAFVAKLGGFRWFFFVCLFLSRFFQSRYKDKTGCLFYWSQQCQSPKGCGTALEWSAASPGPGDEDRLISSFQQPKELRGRQTDCGSKLWGKAANLCSSGRWPVENNPEESKQVPAKNFRLGRSSDLWTCKRHWRPTSGGQPWAELSWPITQRKGTLNPWQMKQNIPFFHVTLFYVF